MDYEVVAEGIGTDTSAAETAATKIPTGALVELRVFVSEAPKPEALTTLQSDLLAKGVVLAEPLVYESGVVIARYFNQPAPPPSQTASIGVVQFLGIGIVGWVVGAIATIGTVVFAWQMSKQVGNTLNNPLLIFAAVALVIIYFMIKSPSKPASQEVQQ